MMLLKPFLITVFSFFLAISCSHVNPAVKTADLIAGAESELAGTVKIGFDRLFSSKLNTIDVDVFFYPELNMAALVFRHEFVIYRQFWSESDRQQFLKGLILYNNDFKKRTLLKNHRKTREIYGKTKGLLEWETFKFARNHVSQPIIEMGYRFRGETPFFSILMHSAKEDARNLTNGKALESPQINLYLTRTQADDLAELFNKCLINPVSID